MPSHLLVDFLTSPWAIVPDKLFELQAIYAAHFRGETIDVAAIEARLGRPLANEQQAYRLQEGTAVAVLEISGVIAAKANMFTAISGGAAASLLEQQVRSMQADPRVKSAVLNIDSPGGNVLGIPSLATAIAELAAVKPVVAVATGTMASAAYWLGSAANAVYISGATDLVGSIGVIATHTYDPKRAAVQTTEVTAGKYKRMASDLAPLSAEGRNYLQGQVDEIYRVFVDAVAQHRSVSVEQVLAHMADGRVFIGQQALDAGLVDGVSTVDAMVEQLATDPGRFATRTRASFAAAPRRSAGTSAEATPATAATADPTPTEGVSMTPQEQAAQFAAEHPEAAALLNVQAADAERARIQAVMGQAMPGHDALVQALAFDGKTTAGEAAVQVLAAERAVTAERLARIQGDRPAALPAAASETATDTPAVPAVPANPMAAAHNLRDAIATKQAEAKQAGRTLSAVQALALVKQEQSNG